MFTHLLQAYWDQICGRVSHCYQSQTVCYQTKSLHFLQCGCVEMSGFPPLSLHPRPVNLKLLSTMTTFTSKNSSSLSRINFFNFCFSKNNQKVASLASACYHTFALKSAAPVAALVAWGFKATPHTAPLWPSNVPIQSPVSPCRSIGFPSVNIMNSFV